MKTKFTIAAALAIAAFSTTNAQNTFPNNGNVGVGTLAPATSLQVIGTSRFGAAANYAQFDGSGNLNFTGAGNYRVGGNRYAFQFSGNPNYGLFFNSTDVRYEFRDGGALPVFYVGANDGNSVFTGGVRVGNSTLTNAGNIRWTGADFQGYNGAAWVSFTATGGGSGWGLTGNSGTNPGINFIGTSDNTGFSIRTNNVEKLRILADGKVGIGTTSANARLHINSAAGEDALRVAINGSTRFLVNELGGASIGSSTEGPANGLYVNGNVGIGVSAPAAKLQVSGGSDVTGTGGGHIIVGTTAGLNIGIDENELGAHNGAAPSPLSLNISGGDVQIGQSMRSDDVTGFVKVGDVATNPARELDITHGTSSGAAFGLRLKNGGGNNEDWTFYTTNATGDLEMSENGILRGSFDEVSGVYSSISDRRLKKDFEDAGLVLDKIKQLQVKKYNFINTKEKKYKTFGLIAQDVEAVFPEIVKHNIGDDKSDVYTMDYSAFGVIAIKAIQEQQEKINSQDKKIEELTKLVNQLLQSNNSASNAIVNSKTILTGAALEQNTPNPFNSITTIRYNIPSSVKTAQIMVANAAGNTIKTFNLSNKGAGNVTINANELTAGSYYYTLIVDGKKADSKQMVLLR